MVRKLKSLSQQKKSGAAALLDSHVAALVKDSAQQIWLAGMGAFSKAQEEGGKVFETLVKEGLSLQKKTQGLAEDKISEVTGRMSAMAETVTTRAGQNWDKLETLFEQRTAKALSKLGVPTAKDVDALVKRIDALTAQVAALNGASAPARRPRAAQPKPEAAARKAPAKRAARKQAAA
ncbi:MAG: phasin family protein [Burkholderiales bacterium]|nr:phasin family protein [Burkholderiales bacterium]